MRRVLFILPPSHELYAMAKVKVAVPERPSLTFATLAAPLLKAGHEVRVLNLDMENHPMPALERQLNGFSPDYVGTTCTTPLVGKVKHLTSVIKKHNKNTIVVTGGPHPSALPETMLTDSEIDIVCIGEGDFTMAEIVSGTDLSSIKGISYRKDGAIVTNPKREYLADLDQLPLPAWNLFDLKKYKTPRLTCRKNPVGTMETSRGCVFGCTYCNKNIFGRTFRVKSPKRVVDEMEYMLDAGFKEIHIMDDGFSTDLDRAKQTCALIKERGLNFPWNLHNGVRVDRVDPEFMRMAHDAGCYAITFGVESGDQDLLNTVHKGITLDQVRKAFKWAKEARLETLAFFMFGLPGETEETMRRTIDFAKELDPDYTKVSILLPLPGTELYRDFEQKGYIKSKDWALYNQHEPSGVYVHPNLDWKTIHHYYDLFYRRYYFRPKIVWKQLKKDTLNGNLLYDFAYVLKTKW